MDAPRRQVRLAGRFAAGDLDRLLEALAPLTELTTPTELMIDLRSLSHISASSVAVLVSALLDTVARGVVAPTSRMVAPRDVEVRRRLQELDVLELLVDRPPEEDFVRKNDRGSRPCQWFTEDDDPGQVARSLTDAMAEVCPTDGPACNAMWFALNEIAQNVFDHAQAPGGGVGIAEVTRGGTEFIVAIADQGVGVRSSLARNPSYTSLPSDLAALRTAMQAGVTARPEKPGGLGLFVTHQLLRHNGGALIMRSGTAQLELGATPSEDQGLAELPGTLVTLRFRTDQPFSLGPILPTIDPGS